MFFGSYMLETFIIIPLLIKKEEVPLAIQSPFVVLSKSP